MGTVVIPERGSLTEHPALILASDLVVAGGAGRMHLTRASQNRDLWLRDGVVVGAAGVACS